MNSMGVPMRDEISHSEPGRPLEFIMRRDLQFFRIEDFLGRFIAKDSPKSSDD